MKLVGTQGSAGATTSVAGGRGRHFDGLAGPTEQSARALASPHGILGHAARAIEGTHGICGALGCRLMPLRSIRITRAAAPGPGGGIVSETHAAVCSLLGQVCSAPITCNALGASQAHMFRQSQSHGISPMAAMLVSHLA